MKCPKCCGMLTELAIEDTFIDHCPGCKGLWFDRGEMAFVTDLQIDLPNPQAERTVGTPTKYPCPRCAAMLEELRYVPLRDLRVDRCVSCRGVWLDRDEIVKVGEIASGISHPRSKIVRITRQIYFHST